MTAASPRWRTSAMMSATTASTSGLSSRFAPRRAVKAASKSAACASRKTGIWSLRKGHAFLDRAPWRLKRQAVSASEHRRGVRHPQSQIAGADQFFESHRPDTAFARRCSECRRKAPAATRPFAAPHSLPLQAKLAQSHADARTHGRMDAWTYNGPRSAIWRKRDGPPRLSATKPTSVSASKAPITSPAESFATKALSVVATASAAVSRNADGSALNPCHHRPRYASRSSGVRTRIILDGLASTWMVQCKAASRLLTLLPTLRPSNGSHRLRPASRLPHHQRPPPPQRTQTAQTEWYPHPLALRLGTRRTPHYPPPEDFAPAPPNACDARRRFYLPSGNDSATRQSGALLPAIASRTRGKPHLVPALTPPANPPHPALRGLADDHRRLQTVHPAASLLLYPFNVGTYTAQFLFNPLIAAI
mmetsp:Transcript_27491/g.50824  ORF Transcript_27491/g.50824 Transcript_27491/m.50824 type:complete len:420 (+) Transcript_27491:554-1813(+)